MENIFVEFLPPWVETGLQPAFYDKESGTVLQQTARMYARVNMLIRMFNKLSKNTKETVEDYINRFNELYTYVHNYFDNLDVQEEINNKLDDMAESGELETLIINYFKEYYVSYSEFGAKGDGVTDDFSAILDAHTYANANGIPVKAEANKTYYVKNITQSIPIQTDVDWNGSSFIIDDTDSGLNNVDLFEIPCSEEINVINQINQQLDRESDLSGLTNLGFCIVEIKNVSKKDFIRTGGNPDSGSARTEYFMITNNGQIINPLQFEFNAVTSALARPVPESNLTIKNGKFTTLVNTIDSYNYIKRGILIERSNVTVDNISHTIDGEDNTTTSSPYNGFITTHFAYNIKIQNCMLSAHKTFYTSDNVAKGSYDLNNNGCINVYYDNVKQINSITLSSLWGIHGSNYCKNIYVNNCDLNRVDAHKGVTNLYITNSLIGRAGINVIGFGDLNIENTTALFYTLVQLREDFGAFWKGKIKVRNCKIINNSTSFSHIIFARNNQNHDYGYKCYLPDLDVDGLFINNSSSAYKQIGFLGVPAPSSTPDFTKTYEENASNNIYPHIFPSSIKVKNVTTIEGSWCMYNVYMDPFNAYFESKGYSKISNSTESNFLQEYNTVLEIDNVPMSTEERINMEFSVQRNSLFYSNSHIIGITENSTHRAVMLAKISNCDYLQLSNQGRFCTYRIKNSSIYQMASGYTYDYGIFIVDNCELHCKYNVTPSSSVKLYRITQRNYKITNSKYFIDDENVSDVINLEDIFRPKSFSGHHMLARYISINNNFNITDEQLAASSEYDSHKNMYFYDPYTYKTNLDNSITNVQASSSSYRPDYNLKAGMTFYNTSTNKLEVYNGSAWIEV